MPTCNYCEDSETEYTCPDCGDPTCEDCFVPMTQFNAGRELPCLACDGKYERERHAENDREYEQKKASEDARELRSAQARARYRSPEAVAKRASAKVARREARAAQGREQVEKLAEAMSGFLKFF